MGAGLDLTSQRFGKLVALEALPSAQYGKMKRTRWLTLCDCGERFVAWTFLLVTGRQKSCGCLCPPAADLAGQTLGKLRVVERMTTTVYRCVCECTTVKMLTSIELKTTRSCGCSRRGRVLGPVKRYDVGAGRLLTVAEMAAEVGVSDVAIRNRMERGLSPAAAMRPPMRRGGKVPITNIGEGSAPWNERRYAMPDGAQKTKREAAASIGITMSALMNRMSDGLSAAEAVALGNNAAATKYEVYGHMLTLPQLAAISGRDAARLSIHLRAGRDPVSLLKPPSQRARKFGTAGAR